MRRLRIAAAAQQDLAAIAAYTAEHWGPLQIRRYVLALQGTFLKLLKQPGLGTTRPDLGSHTRLHISDGARGCHERRLRDPLRIATAVPCVC